MKKIGRKIYYEKSTGNVIVNTGERMGDVVETTTEQDFLSYQALKERVPETIGVIQLAYGQYAQDFSECNGYRVNLDTFALEFSYPDPNNPEPQEPVYEEPLSTRVAKLEAVVDTMLGV